MIKITNRQDCCGCLACVQKCPQRCIRAYADEEGFLYPVVDLQKCIDCGVCERTCPIINRKEKGEIGGVFAAVSKNDAVRLKSSSGGIFSLMAENIIAAGGVVFGAKFDDNWQVVHSCFETAEELNAFRGSKYVQSNMQSAYIMAQQYLKDGRKVLFTGTPCQIAGLKQFLNKEYPNLYAVDLLCHGVPSPKVWDLYLNSVCANRKNITKINMRDKSTGWMQYSFLMEVSGKKAISEKLDENPFRLGFLNDIYLRPSCYSCKFRGFRSKSDITLGDFWRVDKYCNKSIFADDKGVSLIFVNSQKGGELLKAISDAAFVKKLENYNAKDLSAHLFKSVPEPRNRRKFFAALQNDNLLPLIKKYAVLPLSVRIKTAIIVALVKVRNFICKK